MSRTGWQFYGWWGIVLPAFLVIWVTNALTLAGTSLGNALIPQLNTALIAEHGWREAFTIICLIPLLLLPVKWFVVKEWPERIGLHAYGAADAAKGVDPRMLAGYEFGAALRSANFWLIGTAAFCTFYAILGVANNLFLHMSDLGFGPADAARAYFPLFVMGLIGKIAAGAAADVLPRKAVFGGCLALMFAGALLLATLKPGMLIPALYLLGLGWGGNYTMLQGLVAVALAAILLVRLPERAAH